MTYPPDEQPPQPPGLGLPQPSVPAVPQPPGLGVPPSGAPSWPPPEAPPSSRGKKIGIAVSIIVAIFVVLAIIGALVGPPADVAGYANGKTGVLYTSPTGGYSALFPKKPKTTTQNVTLPQLTLHFTLEMSGDNKDGIAVGFVDYPAQFAQFQGAQLDTVLTGAANGAAGNISGGHLESYSFTTLVAHRAIKYKITTSGPSVYSLAVLVGARLYVLEAISTDHGQQALDRLLGSFKLS